MNSLGLIAGLKGFDADGVLRPTDIKGLWNKGYRFALRYVRRVDRHSNDLGKVELDALLDVGFGVMPVQHVEPGFWTPTVEKARTYGDNAALAACELGFPKGVTVWMDLESVAAGTPTQDVIDYCNLWHSRVHDAGFQPGLYVGYQPRISARDLYLRLRFDRFWAAYNLNHDQIPATRGVCMIQHVVSDHGLGFDFDGNVSTLDNLGGYATMAVK